MRFVPHVIGLLWLLSSAVFAGSFTAEIDRNGGVEGDQFTLSFRVQGNHEREPQVPPIPDVEIAGAGTSTNISIVNGSFTKETGYSYSLFPKKAGTYTIPSVSLEVDGETLATLPLTIKVEASGKAQAGEEAGEAIFIKREFSNPNPYVGEPIIETTRIYHKVRIEQASPSSAPPPDFRSLSIEGEGRSREQVGNDVYEVITIHKVLVPLSAGEKIIPPFSIDAVVIIPSQRGRGRDPFWDMFGGAVGQRARKAVASAEGLINVKGIPADGRPVDYKGLVGNFQLQTEISQRQLKIGDTSTLTITVRGRGILDRLKEPDLQLGGQFKVYSDKAEIKEQVTAERGVESEKVFKFALVPTAAGTMELPEFTLPVFDPEAGQFILLRAALGSLTVEGGANESAVVVKGDHQSRGGDNKVEVKAIGNDLLDLHRHIELSEDHDLDGQDALPLAVIGLMPGAMALLGIGIRVRRRRGHADGQQTRRSKAYKNFRVAIQAPASQDPVTLATVYDAYRTLLGDKLGLHGKALTAKEIDGALTQRKVPGELRQEAVAVVAEMEHLAYSGNTLKGEDAERIRQQILKLANEVDRKC